MSDRAEYVLITRRQYRGAVIDRILGGALAVLTAAAVAWAMESDERASATTVQVKTLGSQLSASPVCQSPNPVVGGYDLTELCTVADRVATAPEPDQVDVEALASSITALVIAGLPERIDAAVSRYMAANPQRQAPSRDEIRAWVVAEVAKIPPPANGAPGKTGASGKDGEDAPPPTDEQIDASVARWFEAHPVNDCPGVWRGPFVDESGSTIYHCEVP